VSDDNGRKRRNVPQAVLFADVAGSTRLYEVLGDTRALELIGRTLEELSRVCRQHGGEVIKTVGDELLCVFNDASTTVQSATDMQLAVAKLSESSPMPMAVRIGFHFGEVLRTDTDVFGDTVNVAARVVSLAKGAQILTTADTIHLLASAMQAAARPIDAFTLRGKENPLLIHEVVWKWDSNLTMMDSAGPYSDSPPATRKLVLEHLGEAFEVNEARSALLLGREMQSDLVVTHRKASRVHARIEQRRDKFVLVDLSTNGTFVLFDGDKELFVRREELPLRANGSLSCGEAHSGANAEIIRFYLA
jgi:adenylate cyclase